MQMDIELASRIYFNKSTKDLTLSEAANFCSNARKLQVRNNPIRNPEQS